MIDGLFSDDPLYPSFLLGTVTVVHEDRHSVDLQPFRQVEVWKDVPLFRSPGYLSLPQVDDVAIVILDDRYNPCVVGIYPKFIHDGIQIQKDYTLRAAEQLIQSERGGRLMMLNSGIIRLVNWLDQGIEIDEPSGAFFVRSHSKKNSLAGVIERSGYIKRKFAINIAGSNVVLDHDNNELPIRKFGTIISPGTLTQADIGNPQTSLELYEKKTEVKVPGSITTNTPDGVNLFEDTVGAAVIPNTPTGVTYTETLHTDSGLPLRRKTVYYDPTGTTPILTEEIDTNGNLRLFVSPTATLGIKVSALVPTLLSLLNLTVNTTGNINLNGATINLNGASDSVVLATKLIAALVDHTHTVTSAPGTTGPAVLGPTLTAPLISSSTIKGV